MIYRHYATPEAVARAVAEEAFVRPSREGWVHIAGWLDTPTSLRAPRFGATS